MRGWIGLATVLLLAATAAGCLGAGDEAAPTPAGADDEDGGAGPEDVQSGNGTGDGAAGDGDGSGDGAAGNGTDSGGGAGEAEGGTNGTSPLPETLAGYEVTRRVEMEGGPSFIFLDEARDVLLVGRGFDGGLATFDVSEPANPTFMGQLLETREGDPLTARSMDLVERNGTPYAVVAGSTEGIHVVDVSDPADPRLVATTDRWPSHHLAAVPGTPYVYDAHEAQHFLVPVDTTLGPTDKARGPVVPVLDLTDPTAPTWTSFPIPASVGGTPTTSDGCHHVSVRADLGQAYCAGGGEAYGYGGGETFIWDVTGDPADPEWVGLVDHPAMMYHHQAVASAGGDLLLVGDESFGPNCNRAADDRYEHPVAALWVFDISDPGNPEALGHVQAHRPPGPDAGFGDLAVCGAHLGDLVADRQAAAWSWWSAGTTLVDFSDPRNPTIVDRVEDDGIVTDAGYHEGHVYTGDEDLLVLEITGPDEG